MKTMRFIEALREGLAEEMRRDTDVFQIGESLGREQGGMFKVTDGLDREFPGRVIDSPISEAALGGVAVGAGMFGMRPVVEIMFGSLMPLLLDTQSGRYVTLCIGGENQLFDGRTYVQLDAHRIRAASLREL